MQKKWNVAKIEEARINEISNKYHVSPLMAKLLINRNVKNPDEFLNTTIDSLENPYVILDMDKFVNRISVAKENNEKICIFGDYDVDGITSTTIMVEFLRKSLNMNVMYYLPDRLNEGYGLNKDAIYKIKQSGANVIVTVDCGITAVDEAIYAEQIGIDLIITDHHKCPEILPQAVAIVNNKRRGDKSRFNLHAGVGIAYKCISALAIKYSLEKESYEKYLDIVALGTISDIVSLTEENRTISKCGLITMQKTKNIGLKELMNVSKLEKNITSSDIAFMLAPRINACGRMGESYVPLEMLLEKDEKKAKVLAKKLDSANKRRQKVEGDVIDIVREKIEKDKLYNESAIVVYDENLHSGVIGIVASKFAALYYKPVIILTKEDGEIKGSGRTVEGIPLYDILLECKDCLLQFGGHALAAGITLEEDKIDEFKERFKRIVKEKYSSNIEESIMIDACITKDDLNVELLKDICAIRPYGVDNPEPIFIIKNLKVESITTAKEEKHLKLVLRDDKTLIVAMGFSLGSRRNEIMIGEKIDIVCKVTLNTYGNKKTIQLVIVDFKKV